MYQKIVLPNGARILAQPMPGIRSAAIGIWVTSGTRNEKASENGAAHFIEHMVFKGSDRFSAAQLAEEMDDIGGQVNAYTTKECTCFYAHVLDCHLLRAWELLTSMVLDAKFAQEDVETERGVVLEEIGMYRDEPDDLVSEQLAAKVYRGTPLARPILGTASTLNKMTGESLKAWHDTHYGADRIVVCLAGAYDDKILDAIQQRLAPLEPRPIKPAKAAVYQPSLVLKRKATEQNHMILAFPSFPIGHPRRPVLLLLSTILGGGMSSRLFQQVREKQGLCYSVSSYDACFNDTGMFCIYTATSRETELRALQTIRQEIDRMVQQGVSQQELDRAKEQAKVNILMALESTSARMNDLARSELCDHGVFYTADERIETYQAITREEIRELAQELFDFSQASLSAVGRIGAQEDYRETIL